MTTIIRVPTDVAVSPQDGSQLRWLRYGRLFKDESENTWLERDLAPCRPGNKIRKWLDENYPESTGD